jgi:tetratricopeptide (TPR) repeat protein
MSDSDIDTGPLGLFHDSGHRTVQTERIKGIFSSEGAQYVGFGATKQRVKKNYYIFAEEDEDGAIRYQALGDNMVPTGPKKPIAREELLKEYLPEPQLYLNTVLPKLKEADAAAKRGDEQRAQGRGYSAEFEYKEALRIQEDHVRSTFGLGLVYLDRGDREAAVNVFKRLVGIRAAFEPEHKHLFNEFGMKLRKGGLLPQALKYYGRAYRLSRNDDHLLFNMARVLYEKGKTRQARLFLQKSLSINEGMEESRQFLEFLERREARAEAAEG